MLRFAEELLLLLIDEESSEPVNVPDRTLGYALAGATLLDLALERRTDSDAESLILIDRTPLGDDLLDPALADIAQESESRSPDYWLARIAAGAEELRDAGRWSGWLNAAFWKPTTGAVRSPSRVSYPAPDAIPVVDGQAEQEIRTRVMGVLFTDGIPSPRDTVIISLANACGVFQRVLSATEYEQVKERIDLIAGLELEGRAVTEAIRNENHGRIHRSGADNPSAGRRLAPGARIAHRRQRPAYEPGSPVFPAVAIPRTGPRFRDTRLSQEVGRYGGGRRQSVPAAPGQNPSAFPRILVGRQHRVRLGQHADQPGRRGTSPLARAVARWLLACAD